MHVNQKRKTVRIINVLVLFSLMWFMCASHLFAKKVATLPELMEVGIIRVKQDRIFVTSQASVYIYSLKDFKLIKKFGRQGEGPREFLVTPGFATSLWIEVLPKSVCINSIGKVSFFTLDGEFIEEIKAPVISYIRPIGKNFSGITQIDESNKSFRTFNLYDQSFTKIKEFYRERALIQPGRQVTLDKSDDLMRIWNHKIVISGKKGMVLHLFDKNGKKITTINEKYTARTFDADSKKALHAYLKAELKEGYDYIKDKLVLPDYFPAISNFYSDNKYLYAGTFVENDKGKTEFYVFNAEGKLLKRVFLPIAKIAPVKDFPIDFYQGKLYQLVENEKTEKWDVHVIDVMPAK